jgi:hypothetical protein
MIPLVPGPACPIANSCRRPSRCDRQGPINKSPSESDTVPCSYWLRQTQLYAMGLVLIGCARLSRSHFQIKKLLNRYRAGAHCNL